MPTVLGHKTAISRRGPSVPCKFLQSRLCFGYAGELSILDYGCGKGADIRYLGRQGYNVIGYDPHHFPVTIEGIKFDIILCSYVLNVLPTHNRQEVIDDIKEALAPDGQAYITVRRDLPPEGKDGRDCYQYNVELTLPIVKQTSSYCIYRLNRGSM